ncbi:DUF3592 domain-containing protein [Nocardiopsis potens]|uniref:DUF3592 domain-containing protein n=1 Tax=Nocardiopsis potens TaxID=1246458 RepID=UPI00034A7706|nr:DUF3592 domain-containing protein [Nocardiopsis potens]
MQNQTFLFFALAAAGIFLYHLFTWVRDVLRRRKRSGAEAEAVVDRVEPVEPPEATEHPFVLRYRLPSGAEHVQRFDRGLDGVVPEPGERLRVRFDPADPANAEVAGGSCTGPLPGAPEPKRPGAVARALPRLGLLLVAALFVTLFLVSAQEGELFLPLFGLLFAVTGLFTAAGGTVALYRNARLRRSPMHTTGEVTHMWEEWRTRGSGNDRRRYRVHPYTVRYTVADGRVVHRRSPEASSSPRYRVGDLVEVYYDASEPTRFSPGSPGGGASAAGYIGIGIGVLFALGGGAAAFFTLP